MTFVVVILFVFSLLAPTRVAITVAGEDDPLWESGLPPYEVRRAFATFQLPLTASHNEVQCWGWLGGWVWGRGGKGGLRQEPSM